MMIMKMMPKKIKYFFSLNLFYHILDLNSFLQNDEEGEAEEEEDDEEEDDEDIGK